MKRVGVGVKRAGDSGQARNSKTRRESEDPTGRQQRN